MKYYDLHTHTTYSDSEIPLEKLVETARQKGYALGISDHLFCGGMNTLADVERYLDALDSYDVLRGCEANIGEDYSLPDSLAARLDYIIASVHSFPDLAGGVVPMGDYLSERAGEPVKWTRPIDDTRSEEYLEAILSMTEHTMQTQRMDIYGHCTVLPFCETLAGTAFLRDWENALLALCKKYNVALEISALWKEPGLDLIRRARETGLRFTLGSDCHLFQDACNLDYAIDAVQKAGITEPEFYCPKRA